MKATMESLSARVMSSFLAMLARLVGAVTSPTEIALVASSGRDWREDAMEQDTGWLHVGWFP